MTIKQKLYTYCLRPLLVLSVLGIMVYFDKIIGAIKIALNY